MAVMRTALPSWSSRVRRQSVPAPLLLTTRTTDASGRCLVPTLRLSAKRVVTVTRVVRATFIYKSQSNHDPDGDSNGTVITVARR